MNNQELKNYLKSIEVHFESLEKKIDFCLEYLKININLCNELPVDNNNNDWAKGYNVSQSQHKQRLEQIIYMLKDEDSKAKQEILKDAKRDLVLIIKKIKENGVQN